MKKTPKIKPASAYVIVSPKGIITMETLRTSKWQVDLFLTRYPELYKNHRCIPVTVSPTKKKKKP